jgi:hypothetical protein
MSDPTGHGYGGNIVATAMIGCVDIWMRPQEAPGEVFVHRRIEGGGT